MLNGTNLKMIQLINFYDKHSEVAYDIGILVHGIVFFLTNIFGENISDVGMYWFLIIWSFGLYLMSIRSRHHNWIRCGFYWIATYNLFDSLRGGGLTLQSYELALFLSISIYSYFKYKHNWTP